MREGRVEEVSEGRVEEVWEEGEAGEGEKDECPPEELQFLS